MASSTFTTKQYASDEFVESCGAVVFQHPTPTSSTRVCLIHYTKKNEWLLPKGRRNCNEQRHEAALREFEEETGYTCHLYPVAMQTRAPAAAEAGDVPDRPRRYANLTEPFMFTLREMEHSNAKLIFWYIAEAQHGTKKDGGEAEFVAKFVDCDAALQTLTFEGDREILSKAIAIVTDTRVQGVVRNGGQPVPLTPV